MGVTDASISPLTWISPTKYLWLRRCPFHVALNPPAEAPLVSTPNASSPFAALGVLAHAVLEELLKDDASDLEAAWARATTARALALLRLKPGSSALRRVRARLDRVIPRIQSLLQEAGDGATGIPEHNLETLDHMVRGRADLVIRGPDKSLVIDYKSGLATAADGEPEEDHVTQLQVYAALEAETTGRWPERAVLLSLKQGEVSAPIDPAGCSKLLDGVRQAVADFNAHLPGRPPCVPAAANCRHCTVAARCPCFWSSVRPGWLDSTVPARVQAVRGVVAGPPEHSMNGRMAVALTVVGGRTG